MVQRYARCVRDSAAPSHAEGGSRARPDTVLMRCLRVGSAAFFAVSVAFGACTVTAGAADAPNAPSVPIGVTIPTALSATVSSQTVHRGDPFTFVTTRDENLGGVTVPKGTPGVGRIAAVAKAYKGHNGSVSLQADMLQLPGGRSVWVNITSGALKGHYANKHVFPYIVPIPPLIFPGAVFTRTGDLVLDSGTKFAVVTTAPRRALAPLVGGAAPAGPVPASPSSTPFPTTSPVPLLPPSPAASSSALPAPSPSP